MIKQYFKTKDPDVLMKAFTVRLSQQWS